MNSNSTYWQSVEGANLRYLNGGDIVVFGSNHSAYVSGVTKDINGYPTIITVANIRFTGDAPVTENLQTFGSGSESTFKHTYHQIYATGYFKIKTFTVPIVNSFGGGSVKIDSVTTNSGTPVTGWTQTHTIEASNQYYQAPGQQNYYRIYKHWLNNGAFDGTVNPKTIQIYASPLITYTAFFNRRFNIRFQNCYADGPVYGTVKVNGGTYNSPTDSFFVEEGTSISAEAVTYQVVNLLQFTFSAWGNGISNPTNPIQTGLIPTDHTMYTANFTVKPLPPDNIVVGGQPGNPVQISWTMHPSTNVTEYQIWRKIKPKTGPDGNPVLLSTLPRATTSYTDWGYEVTSGYTDDIVYYDVRSHFVAGSTSVYSDVNWSGGIFATDQGAQAAPGIQDVLVRPIEPTEFMIGMYPNPFNPSTTVFFQLVENATVSLDIFDMTGRKVHNLVQGFFNEGYHSVKWDAKDNNGNAVASGVYFYRFTAIPSNGKNVILRNGKLLLMR